MLIDAAKYGQIVEPLHGGGTGPLHFSGITPQGHRHPVFDMQNTPAFPERAVRERYQRNELKGFTTQELYDLDAISDRDLPMSTLEIQSMIFSNDGRRTGRQMQSGVGSIGTSYIHWIQKVDYGRGRIRK